MGGGISTNGTPGGEDVVAVFNQTLATATAANIKEIKLEF